MLVYPKHSQFSPVAQSRPTLCDPLNRSTPGCHPLLLLTPNPSKHQSLFQNIFSQYLCFGFIFSHIKFTLKYFPLRSDQSLSRVRLFATPWITARRASLSITNSQSFLKTHVHRVSDAIQPPHPLSSSVVPFSSCPQSLPASESFPMSQLFASGSQSTGVSALASFLPKKSQGWSPSEWTGWISL